VKTGLMYAAETFKNQASLAKDCGVTPANLRHWRGGLPPEYCLELNKKYGLDLHRLNPAVYPARLFK
jgi:hypothetical protein